MATSIQSQHAMARKPRFLPKLAIRKRIVFGGDNHQAWGIRPAQRLEQNIFCLIMTLLVKSHVARRATLDDLPKTDVRGERFEALVMPGQYAVFHGQASQLRQFS